VPSGRDFEGIKDPKRTVEKVCRTYAGRCDQVLDLLRATVVADDLEQMRTVVRLLTDTAEKFDERVTVHRIKNKFDPAAKARGGFRNIHFNLTLKHPTCCGSACCGTGGTGFVCELQIQHRKVSFVVNAQCTCRVLLWQKPADSRAGLRAVCAFLMLAALFCAHASDVGSRKKQWR
jgi:hypothetical protein